MRAAHETETAALMVRRVRILEALEALPAGLSLGQQADFIASYLEAMEGG